MIDTDHVTHGLSNRVTCGSKNASRGLGWLSIGAKASHAIETLNGISILPAIEASDVKASDAIREAVARARSAGGYDLVILDGPATPWSASDRKLLDLANGFVAVLPARLDINECMENIITELGGTEHKLVGVVLNELNLAAVNGQQDRHYA